MINIKSKTEIQGLRAAAELVSATFQEIAPMVKPGAVLKDIDKRAEQFILKHKAETLYKGIRQRPGQRPFPGSITAAVNYQICHGIPDNRTLKDGDIVGIDIGLRYKGWCGDACYTYEVGDVTPEVHRLVETTKESLVKGIEVCLAKNRIGAIGAAIQKFAESRGYSVVREYGGHGIGRELWEEPFIPHVGFVDRGPIMRPGLVINIEPMINMGRPETRLMNDEWTVETADHSLSAQFEQTVLITEGEPEILTKL